MQTIEQAARKFAAENEIIKIKDAFKAGVEFAQQWHSVEDELPKRDSNPSFNHQSDIILLKNKSGNIFSGYYDYDMDSFFDYVDDEVLEIIEWKPIDLK